MIYRKFNETYMVRMDVGEEIMEQLMTLCVWEHIMLAQVDAIGATGRRIKRYLNFKRLRN